MYGKHSERTVEVNGRAARREGRTKGSACGSPCENDQCRPGVIRLTSASRSGRRKYASQSQSSHHYQSNITLPSASPQPPASHSDASAPRPGLAKPGAPNRRAPLARTTAAATQYSQLGCDPFELLHRQVLPRHQVHIKRRPRAPLHRDTQVSAQRSHRASTRAQLEAATGGCMHPPTKQRLASPTLPRSQDSPPPCPPPTR